MLSFKRGNRKEIANFKTLDVYKLYRQRRRDKELDYVEYGQFARILQTFNENIINLMVHENVDFNMSHRTGSLRVRKKPVRVKLKDNGDVDKRNLSVNWKKTKEYWIKKYPGLTAKQITDIPNKKLIYELNEHTEGNRFVFYWDKITCNLINQSAYVFNPTRSNKQKLTVALKTIKNLNYYE